MTAVADHPRRNSVPHASRGVQPACEGGVGFICVQPAHVAAAMPGIFGYLVMHHGTCGYCPGQPDGLHRWADSGGVTLKELLRRTSEHARPRPVERWT